MKWISSTSRSSINITPVHIEALGFYPEKINYFFFPNKTPLSIPIQLHVAFMKKKKKSFLIHFGFCESLFVKVFYPKNKKRYYSFSREMSSRRFKDFAPMEVEEKKRNAEKSIERVADSHRCFSHYIHSKGSETKNIGNLRNVIMSKQFHSFCLDFSNQKFVFAILFGASFKVVLFGEL